MSAASRSSWRRLRARLPRRERHGASECGHAMNILFIMDRRANAGSIQAIASYVRAGDDLGHTIALYGHPDAQYARIPWFTHFSLFDHVAVVCEFWLGWMSRLGMVRILSHVP